MTGRGLGPAACALVATLVLSGCAASAPAPDVSSTTTSTGPGQERTEQHWTRPVARIDVDEPFGPGGGIDVAPGPPGRLDVTLDLSWRGARPVTGEDWVARGPARIDPAGDVRRTAVGCAAAAPSGPAHDCAARYAIALPADADLGARTTVDPITVHDRRGDTALTSSSGPITMTDLAGTVRATSERGAIVGARLAPETVYVVAGGPVDLRLAAPPRELRVDGGAGPVVVELPRGASYAVETGVRRPSAGPARVEVATDPASPHVVEVRGEGELTVRYSR